VPEAALSAFVDWTLVPSPDAPTGFAFLFPDLRKEIYGSLIDPWHGKAAPAPIRRLMTFFFGNIPGQASEVTHSWHEPEEDRLDQINHLKQNPS